MNDFATSSVGIFTKAQADAYYLKLTDVSVTPTANLVPRADGSHILAAGWMPAFTGDASSVAGATAITLATVNGNVGGFALATITVNAKGLITSASAASTTGSGSVVLATSPTITAPTIAKLSNLSTNGFVKTSGSDGTLNVVSIVSADLTTALTTPPAIGGTTPALGAFTTLSATGALMLSGAPGKIIPASDSTTALGIANAAGTVFINFDTSNSRLGIGTTAPAQLLHIFDGHMRMDQVAPAGAPTVAINASAGNLNGAYQYCVTFSTPTGVTAAVFANLSGTVSPANQQVNLTNIPVSADASVTSRNIYRTTAGGAFNTLKLVTTLSDNTTTTYTDNIADGSLGAVVSWKNTTGGNLFVGANRVFFSDARFTGLGVGISSGSALGGYNSIAFGANALAGITNGYQNSAMGHASLIAVSTGLDNTGVGFNTGVNITAGSNNTSIGSQAGGGNQTGSHNTWIGMLAGAGVAGNNNSFNTGIGRIAGTAITTGSNNTLIGYAAGSTLTTGASNVILGFNIQTPAVGTANYMSLGNLIFSAGVDGTGTTLSSGNIGIGVAAPGTKLHTVKTDAGTNTVVDTMTTGHYSSGTPAASFGTGAVIEGHSANNTVRSMSRMRSLWTTATDASRATRSVISAFDSTGERDVIGWGANGSAALLGFYPTVAAAPIAQPTTAIAAATFAANTSLIANDTATWDSYTIGQVVKALRNLGILA